MNNMSLRKSITLLAIYMIMFANIGYTQYIAEGWQWMKEFQGAELDKEYNSIKQVVMDSAGDYYILGTTGYGGDIDDIALYPEDHLPYNPYIEGGIFFAKIDGYSGDVQWVKKLKHHGADISFFLASILYNKGKIYLWAQVGLVRSQGISPASYFYYLDTAYYLGNGVYTGNYDHNPFPFNKVNRYFDAVVTFDLEGNKIDEHFLCLIHRDSVAIDNAVRSDSVVVNPLLYITNPLGGKLAHIDNDGNMYVYTQSCYAYDEVLGRYNIETDTTLPFKIYVDDTMAYEFKTQEYFGSETCGGAFKNIFLWKFSPDLRPLWPEPKPLIKYVDSCTDDFRFQQTLGNILFVDESSTAYDNSMYFHWFPCGSPTNAEEQTYPMYVYFDSVNRIKIENYGDSRIAGAIIKVDTSGNIEWVSKDKYLVPKTEQVAHMFRSTEYMKDSVIYVIQTVAASSVDNTVYLDEEHQYQLPKCYDLTDNYSDMMFYKKISRRTGEYLGSGTICPKGTSGFEYVFMTDLFEVNDTLYGFASYIKNDFENTGTLSSELVHWDKDNNFLGAVDTIATFGETKESFYPYVFSTGDGRVLVYGNKSVAYSQAPIYFNDTIHLHFTPESKGYFGMLYDSMFVQRTPMEEEDDDTISTHSPLLLHPDVKIYPNPAVSYIYVELPDNITYHKAELWSASGALLQTTTERVLNLHNLSPGTYYIRVYTPEGIGTQKIIKM
ncbi:MAG: T9SS type A sorting domain-containing protein [Bacteroidales bacterium]|nr:T9SS type A sorting domain-containing protein [Bacteroidales bacterium]